MKIVARNFSIFLFLFLFSFNVYADSLKDVQLSKCVDGDTAYFNIDGEEKKFRFLAIDTPESVHPKKKEEPLGKLASSKTCEYLTNAKNIQVEYDKNAKSDKYGRVLAYVYVDSKMLQELLIEEGLAKVAYIYGDYKYTNHLCEVQMKAFSNKIGIWENSNELGYCETHSNKKSEDVSDNFKTNLLKYIERGNYDKAFLLVMNRTTCVPLIIVLICLYVFLKKKKIIGKRR